MFNLRGPSKVWPGLIFLVVFFLRFYPYASVLKVINWEDGSPMFRLIEIDKAKREIYLEKQESVKIRDRTVPDKMF